MLPLPYLIYHFSHDVVFRRLTGDQAILQKMVYVLANLVVIGLAVYKCNAMGLLPTAQSDWLEFMAARKVFCVHSFSFLALFLEYGWYCMFTQSSVDFAM